MAQIYKRLGGAGGTGITSVNGQTGPIVVITKSDVGLGNVDNTSDLNKPISTATQSALDAIKNSQENLTIYLDPANGDDTTGVGSFLNPVQTLDKALDLATNDLASYTFILAPGDYGGVGTLNWKANCSVVGFSALNTNISRDLSLVSIAGDERQFRFDNVSLGSSFTLDLSLANIAIPAFYNGVYNITRVDSAGGPRVVQLFNSSVNTLDVTGTVICNNILFLSALEIQEDGLVLANNCTIGISVNMFGNASINLVASTVPGFFQGTIASGNTPVINTDASSRGTGFTFDTVTINLLDSSEFIKFDPTTPGDWLTPPTEVKTALDELASRVGTASKYIATFNNTTDWTLNGSYYEITILESAHNRGADPAVHMFELVGATYEDVGIDRIQIDASGNLELRVTLTARFPGKVVVI